MKGKFFVEIRDGQLTRQGLIEDDAGPGHYVIVLPGQPTVRQVIAAERMQSFVIFDTPQDMDAWIQSLRQQAAGEPPAKPLAEQPVKVLRQLAKARNIKRYAKLSKAQLVAALEETAPSE